NHLWVFYFLLTKPKTKNFEKKQLFFFLFVIKFCK
ncbi:unnamed protein product, partial [Staurois parvus]